MCILMYFGMNAMPNIDHLRRGADNNPDGFGFAVVRYAADEIIVGRGMDPDRVIEDFMTVRREYPSDTAIFHARIATTGSVCEGNCHPFQVQHRIIKSTDELTGIRAVSGHMVLAHNGVLPCDPPKGDDRSDTKMFAEDILMKRFPHLDSAKTRRRLEAYIGHSKVAILTTDRAYRQQSYIFNSRLGMWQENADGSNYWYSNSSWRDSYYRYTGSTASYTYYAGGSYRQTSADTWDWDESGYENARISYPDDALRLACTRCKYSIVYCTCPGAVTASWYPESVVNTPKAWVSPAAPAVTDDDDDPTWTCKSCEVEGSVGPDCKCLHCGVMFCCDLPEDKCFCWDPASGRLRSRSEISEAKAVSKALVSVRQTLTQGTTDLGSSVKEAGKALVALQPTLTQGTADLAEADLS